jgi:hypothetical protein
MVNKKSLDSYESKRRIFSTKNNTPFMSDFFTKEDCELLIPRIFCETNCHDELVKMLNNSVKYCAKLFPHYNELTPGKGDEKDLFDELQSNFKQTKNSLNLLLHQYGYETSRHINLSKNEITTLLNLLRKAELAMPAAHESLSQTPGKRRGNNTHNATKALISSLIMTYEKLTGKKAAANFKQPKAEGLDYQGNFYNFCVVVFEIINKRFSARCGEAENIFLIQSNDSFSLGSQIRKIFKDLAEE